MDEMTVFVADGKTRIQLIVNKNMTCEELYKRVGAKLDVDVGTLRLICGCVMIPSQSCSTLEDNGVINFVTIHVVKRVDGGD